MDDDFELHQALQEMAPAAVRKLVELGGASNINEDLRVEALARLRELHMSGAFERLPLDLRDEADRLLKGNDTA